jgi:hypothetical protein
MKRRMLAFALYLLNRSSLTRLEEDEEKRHIKALRDLYILDPKHCTEISEECADELLDEGKSIGELGDYIARRVKQMKKKARRKKI